MRDRIHFSKEDRGLKDLMSEHLFYPAVISNGGVSAEALPSSGYRVELHQSNVSSEQGCCHTDRSLQIWWREKNTKEELITKNLNET